MIKCIELYQKNVKLYLIKLFHSDINKMYYEENILFHCPFSMIVSGPSGSGKTFFVRRLLSESKYLFNKTFEGLKVLWVYGQWQNLYSEDVANCDITYSESIPSADEIQTLSPNVIVVDDLMNEVLDDINTGNLFTKISHHLNINVIFITQNLFHQGKQMRNISLSCHYFVLMKNNRDRSQIDILGRQMKKLKILEEAFNDATKSPYSYLLIDFKQQTPENLILRSKIFKDENIKGMVCPIIYVKK
ncbi:MAG: hypothetical protein QM535_19325 [Limnohabitans sp.]|nr:hypothetical protein [Limnohabitans sp.]